MLNPIIVPLDVDHPQTALEIVSQLKGKVGGFKMGPRLTLRVDKSFFYNLKDQGIVFLDHKFFDIPSTTLASVKVAAELGADWVTVHALNGLECLKNLKSLEVQIQKENKNFRILNVTILTSFDENTLPGVFKKQTVKQSVESLAVLVHQAGLTGYVCSPHEIESIKKINNHSFIVTPGIRLGTSNQDDQQRVATPKSAIQSGAQALVIGRPIIEAENPVKVVDQILESIS